MFVSPKSLFDYGLGPDALIPDATWPVHVVHPLAVSGPAAADVDLPPSPGPPGWNREPASLVRRREERVLDDRDRCPQIPVDVALDARARDLLLLERRLAAHLSRAGLRRSSVGLKALERGTTMHRARPDPHGTEIALRWLEGSGNASRPGCDAGGTGNPVTDHDAQRAIHG